MPKLKSKRAAMKRFRFTGTGKVKMQMRGKRHHMHQKTEKRKRRLGRGSYLTPVQADKITRLLPYDSR